MFCIRGCSSVVERLIRYQKALRSTLISPVFWDNSCLPWIYGFVILKYCSGPIKRNVNKDFNTKFCFCGCSSVVEPLICNQKASSSTPDISIFLGQLKSSMDLWIFHIKILFWSNLTECK